MKRIHAALILVLCIGCMGATVEAPLQMQEASAVGQKGKPVNLYGDPGNTFRFTLGNTDLSVTDNGGGVQTDAAGRSRKLKLPVPSGMWLGGPVYFAPYKQDFLVQYGLSSGEESSAKLVRLDGLSLEVKWIVGGVPFNMTPGLIQGGFLYVTGIGFVGAINLDTGRYAWCVRDLYKGENIFAAFQEPTLEGDTLTARDKLVAAQDGTPYFIKVDWKHKKVETNAPLPQPPQFLVGCPKQ